MLQTRQRTCESRRRSPVALEVDLQRRSGVAVDDDVRHGKLSNEIVQVQVPLLPLDVLPRDLVARVVAVVDDDVGAQILRNREAVLLEAGTRPHVSVGSGHFGRNGLACLTQKRQE